MSHIYRIQDGETTFELTEITNKLLISTIGIFWLDEDDMWRCYTLINITNENEENVTITSVYLNALNVTYVDGTSEELGETESVTINQVLQPSETIDFLCVITTYGFFYQPKILWVTLEVYLLESEKPVTSTVAIPEFPSLIFMPLFMIATLSAVIVYRSKHSM